jgi:opacity protein-like surface antigen
MRKIFALLAAVAALALSAPAFADPAPPTNGGNGAGQSGQCTGNPNDRPSSCWDQGGPGNQPGSP